MSAQIEENRFVMTKSLDQAPPVALDTRSFVLFVAGPSGVGKTSICQRIIDNDRLVQACVTTTTRPKRSAEVDGVDYQFVSEDAFNRIVEAGEFIEWAEVHGYLYGATSEAVAKALSGGQVMLLDVDVQGIKTWKAALEDRCVTAFVVPPTIDMLKKQLEERKTEDKASFKTRMEDAQKELSEADGFDYLIVNDDLQQAISDLEAIISAERCRPRRMRNALSRLLNH